MKRLVVCAVVLAFVCGNAHGQQRQQRTSVIGDTLFIYKGVRPDSYDSIGFATGAVALADCYAPSNYPTIPGYYRMSVALDTCMWVVAGPKDCVGIRVDTIWVWSKVEWPITYTKDSIVMLIQCPVSESVTYFRRKHKSVETIQVQGARDGR